MKASFEAMLLYKHQLLYDTFYIEIKGIRIFTEGTYPPLSPLIALEREFHVVLCLSRKILH